MFTSPSNAWRKDNNTFLLSIFSKIILESKSCVFPYGLGLYNRNMQKLITLRNLLADQGSTDILDLILSTRIAFSFLSEEKLEALYFSRFSDMITIKRNESGYDFAKGGTIVLDETFCLLRYEYGEHCKVQPDDYVLDIGAYRGDTAIYFANLTGENGKAFAFEPDCENLALLKKNVSALDYEKIIFPNNFATAEKPGTLLFRGGGGAAKLDEHGDIEVQVTTIDNFVRENEIDHIDFIKADIEGAECSMLRGAVETIKKYTPKLAICIYHKMSDWWEVPQLILECDSRYNFYLKHNSDDRRIIETVLFAVIEDKIIRHTDTDDISDFQNLLKNVHTEICRLKHHKFFDKVISICPVMLWKHERQQIGL